MNILDEIVQNKALEIATKEDIIPISEIQEQAGLIERSSRTFLSALKTDKDIRIIAEIKRRSPSKGDIRADLDPAKLAKTYESIGASAISVLIDNKFFGGSADDLKSARENTCLPILYKEFIISEYQIYEALLSGADAILLIARILDEERLGALKAVADKLLLDCLVEAHSKEDIEKALKINAQIIGINNRNLDTFTVDLRTSQELISLLPEETVKVCESGINTYQDIMFLKEAGASAFLIGEAILKEDNIEKKLSELLGI